VAGTWKKPVLLLPGTGQRNANLRAQHPPSLPFGATVTSAAQTEEDLHNQAKLQKQKHQSVVSKSLSIETRYCGLEVCLSSWDRKKKEW